MQLGHQVPALADDCLLLTSDCLLLSKENCVLMDNCTWWPSCMPWPVASDCMCKLACMQAPCIGSKHSREIPNPECLNNPEIAGADGMHL